MGAACNACQQNSQTNVQQEIRSSAKIDTKKSMIQSSRYKKMPSKQQTLLPIQYDIAQENDQDLQWFENQFVSFPKTATFKSNTHSERVQQLQHSLINQDEIITKQDIKQFVSFEKTTVQPEKPPPLPSNFINHCPPLDSNSAGQSSPYQTYSLPIAKPKIDEPQQQISAINLTPKQNGQSPPIRSKPPKGLDRSKTPNNNDHKRAEFSDVQSMKGERTPSKGILKNKNEKGSKYSRAASEYHRNKSNENQSNKSIQTSKSKKVKFDPKSIREKNRNFMFI